MARVTNLINKADALKQLNASLKKETAKYDKELKQYAVKKAAFDKEIVAYNKAVSNAAISFLKSHNTEDQEWRRVYNNNKQVRIDFSLVVDAKQPETPGIEPSRTMVDRIEKQIRSVSIMAGETFNASMLDDDFFNCL
jgi:hypothetical protein